MDARELSQRLAQNAESVATYLLPNGKKVGSEFCAGSVQGESGNSLKVHLTGNRSGVWADFATGDQKGDLLDLWREAKGVSLAEAIIQAKQFLGIHEVDFHPTVKRSYTRPQKPNCKDLAGPVLDYLCGKRMLTPETLKTFNVEAQDRAIVFPYVRNDELIMFKTLKLDRTPEGKKVVFSSKDTEPCLFGWQALDPNTRTVIICEGEIDCLTLHQYGFPALSVPFGAGVGAKHTWIETEFPYLERFSEILLCFDSDQVGQEAAKDVAQRLGLHRCRLVELPVKDPNEALQAGFTADDLRVSFEHAQWVSPEELRGADEFKAQVDKFLDSSEATDQIITLPWQKTQQDIRLEYGQLTLWTGYNGSGKSELLLHLLAHRMHQGDRVCLASLEVPAVKILGRHILPQVTGMKEPSLGYRAEVFNWLSSRLWLFNLVGVAKNERLFEVFEYGLKRFGINTFVIDSLLKVGIDESDYDKQKRFVEQICDFKNTYPVHVHLVAHSRKKEDESSVPGKMDIRGSGTISDLADNVFSIWRNKPKEEALQGCSDTEELVKFKGKELPAKDVQKLPDAILKCLKQKELGSEPTFKLWFDRDSRQFLEYKDSQPFRYVYYSNL